MHRILEPSERTIRFPNMNSPFAYVPVVLSTIYSHAIQQQIRIQTFLRPLNEGCTEGARGEITCAEGANAQLPGRSRVRTFVITFSTVSRLLILLVIALEETDKIDQNVSAFFDHLPLLYYSSYRSTRIISIRTNFFCLCRSFCAVNY